MKNGNLSGRRGVEGGTPESRNMGILMVGAGGREKIPWALIRKKSPGEGGKKESRNWEVDSSRLV